MKLGRLEIDLEEKLKICAGIGLYAFTFYTFGLMIRELDKGKFLNASIYSAVNLASGTGAKLLIGLGLFDCANRFYDNVKNLPKETKELIRYQMDGFISREIYNNYNNLGAEHEDL